MSDLAALRAATGELVSDPYHTAHGEELAQRPLGLQDLAALWVVIGVNYVCRLATTILAGPTGGSRGVDLGGVVVVAG